MICPLCKGTRKCPYCKGRGKVRCGTEASGFLPINCGAPGVPAFPDCKYCGGTGECPRCQGTGRV